jgi:hypothetical protein
MTPEQKAAYAISMAACATIEAIGMLADNKEAEATKRQLPYLSYDFSALIEKYGIHHNALLTMFHGD